MEKDKRNYFLCRQRPTHSIDESPYDIIACETLKEAREDKKFFEQDGDKNWWITANDEKILIDLFEAEKEYILEIALNKDYYLFIEALDEFGGSIQEEKFNINNIKNLCIELIDSNGDYVASVSNANINIFSDVKQLKDEGFEEIKEIKKVLATEESIAAYMYFEGTKHTEYGTYSFYFDDLIEKLPHLNLTKNWLYDHYENIVSILEEHPGVTSVEEFDAEHYENLYFDINFYGEFCGLTNEDEDFE